MKCPICGCFLLTLKLYVSHLRLVHAKDPAFNIMCGVTGCREVCRTFSAFNSHIYRHHGETIGIDRLNSPLHHNKSPGVEISSASDYVFEHDTTIECLHPAENTSTTVVAARSDVKEKAARFLLNLR